MAWRWVILFWLALWHLSWTQVFALLGFYSPVLIILTPSNMPYLPPLSVLFFVPGELPADGVPRPVVDYVRIWGPIHAPIVHYGVNNGETCYYIIPNAKAVVDRYLTPMAPINFILDLLPPYPTTVVQSPCRWRAYGVFAVPGYAVLALQAFILMAPKMYYRFRRTF